MVADMNILEALHQRHILDVCWWAHVSIAEMLQRSGLSTIGNILRYRRSVSPRCTHGPWSK